MPPKANRGGRPKSAKKRARSASYGAGRGPKPKEGSIRGRVEAVTRLYASRPAAERPCVAEVALGLGLSVKQVRDARDELPQFLRSRLVDRGPLSEAVTWAAGKPDWWTGPSPSPQLAPMPPVEAGEAMAAPLPPASAPPAVQPPADFPPAPARGPRTIPTARKVSGPPPSFLDGSFARATRLAHLESSLDL